MRSFKIAELNFGSARWDYATSFRTADAHFEVQRFGAEYSTDVLRRLIERMRSQVDAIAISGLPTEIRFRDKAYVHRQTLQVMTTPTSIPLTNGERIRELVEIEAAFALSRAGQINPQHGVFFPIGLLHMEAMAALGESFAGKIGFGDLYAGFGAPYVGQPGTWIARVAKLGFATTQFRDLSNLAPSAVTESQLARLQTLTRKVADYRYIWGDPALILLMARGSELLRGKEILATGADPRLREELLAAGAVAVRSIFPKTFSDWSPLIGFAVVDACLRLLRDKSTALSLEEWQEVLESEIEITMETKRFVQMARPSVQTKVLETRLRRSLQRQVEREPDFAFVVHSLSFRDLTRAPGLAAARRLPIAWQKPLEQTLARLPGIVYGRMSGVVSAKSGREVQGLIYGLFATPRVMRDEAPELTYAKIERLCHHAAERGAKIIGLGAYTKIVGDAGATIHRNSPIPVTTGNSLSASATLWALHDAVVKMGLVRLDPATGLVDGTAMAIGATGSIGKVSAKLLALVFKRVCLVAPRIEKLEELRRELQTLSPQTEILLSTNANDFAREADAIVTATSAFDQKIVDIALLKPGCVVCDCSRPLDFSLEDAIARPDVLFIESGEVVLPGGRHQLDCDLGLPEGVVYACLGETAVLAMEGLYEPFTLGRDIEWQKVKQIYRLARAHGVRLAAIRGPSGLISDREIALCRELALKARRA